VGEAAGLELVLVLGLTEVSRLPVVGLERESERESLVGQ
jgi:hypothetical protein